MSDMNGKNGKRATSVTEIIQEYLAERRTPTPPEGEIEEEHSVVKDILAPAKDALKHSRDRMQALREKIDTLQAEVEKKR